MGDIIRETYVNNVVVVVTRVVVTVEGKRDVVGAHPGRV